MASCFLRNLSRIMFTGRSSTVIQVIPGRLTFKPQPARLRSQGYSDYRSILTYSEQRAFEADIKRGRELLDDILGKIGPITDRDERTEKMRQLLNEIENEGDLEALMSIPYNTSGKYEYLLEEMLTMNHLAYKRFAQLIGLYSCSV